MKPSLQLQLPLQPPQLLRPLAVLTNIVVVQIGLSRATVLENTKVGWQKIVASLVTLTNILHIVHTGLIRDIVPKLMSLL